MEQGLEPRSSPFWEYALTTKLETKLSLDFSLFHKKWNSFDMAPFLPLQNKE